MPPGRLTAPGALQNAACSLPALSSAPHVYDESLIIALTRCAYLYWLTSSKPNIHSAGSKVQSSPKLGEDTSTGPGALQHAAYCVPACSFALKSSNHSVMITLTDCTHTTAMSWLMSSTGSF